MDFRPSRLRSGEWIAAGAAVALLVLLLAVRWYGARTGWQALTVLRWFALVTIAAALALACLQATRRAPALPAVASVAVTVLALVAVVWLGVEVLVSPLAHRHVGAFLGLVAACVLLYGGYRSLREEGIAPADGPAEIPTVGAGRQVPS
jgi:hypothetical protein